MASTAEIEFVVRIAASINAESEFIAIADKIGKMAKHKGASEGLKNVLRWNYMAAKNSARDIAAAREEALLPWKVTETAKAEMLEEGTKHLTRKDDRKQLEELLNTLV